MSAARPKRFYVRVIDRRANFAGIERQCWYATRKAAMAQASAWSVIGDVTLFDYATGRQVAFEARAALAKVSA